MWWMFDVVTFFYLIVVGAFFIETATQWKTIRQKKITLAIMSILGLGWISIFYGSFIEPRALVVREQTIGLSEEPTEILRAVVMSDIHLGPYLGTYWVTRVVETIMAQKPDIIFLPGDFIFHIPEEADMLGPLKELFAPYGVYAVTGNHDYEGDGVRYVIETLERLGVKVLENEQERIQVGEKELVLAGVSDLWYEGSTYEALKEVEMADPVILLSHNPDAVLFEKTSLADLVISGHTHGGQIRLPWLGPLSQIPTQLGQSFDKGIFRYADQWLFISAGVGETGPRARLFNPPEINVLTILL